MATARVVAWIILSQITRVACFVNRDIKIREVHVGILDKGAKHKDVYDFALKFIEDSLDILPNTKIVPLYREVTSKPLVISKRVFELLQRGVSTIICHCPSSITQQVANFANEKNIPVIAVTATDPLLANKEQRPYLLRISPSDRQQSAAISDLLAYYQWLHFSIITSYDSYGIHGISGIQKAASSRSWKVNNIQHFTVPEDVRTLNVTKELSMIFKSESRIIILNCGASAAGQVLREAAEFGLTNEGYAWVVTDGVTGNFNDLIVNPRVKFFGAYLDGLVGTTPATKDGTLYVWFMENYSKLRELKRREITPFTRLAFDSVYVFAQALHNYFNDDNTITEQNIDVLQEPGIVFNDGALLYQYLRKVKVNGTSKMLSFDEYGEVLNAKYDIVNFIADEGYFREVGYWTPGKGVRIEDEVVFSGRSMKVPSYQIDSLEKRHLILGVDVDPPFVQVDEGCGSGNGCYSGYCISLVEELSNELGFSYEFVRPSDGTWGGLAKDGSTWTGIFKDLLDRRIDIATVHMSVNSIREKSIDFSVPFMQAGLTVVVRGEEASSDGYFFLSPFSPDVLYAIGAGVLAVVLFVWVYNRISPNGLYWSQQYALLSCKCRPCRTRRREGRQYPRHDTCAINELEARDEVYAHLNMSNSSWIVVASLLNQDPVVSWPTSLPGRIVMLFWWLVVMVVLAMYTANLAAFLTITKMTTGLTKIEDLLTQDRYQWGTVKDTHPEVALANSVREDFKDLIRKQDAVISTDEGFARVLAHDYAFIYESPIFEYMKRKHCSLETVGVGEFLSFDYAFGFPPDSPYTDVINRALLKLQENSKLDTLWNNILQKTGTCPPRPPSAQLTLQSLNGVFTMLGLGLVLSMVALIGEYLYVTWCDVNGKTTGCPPAHRPKTMLGALRRRVRYLVYDLRRSFASEEKQQSLDTRMSQTDLDKDTAESMQKLYKQTQNGAPAGPNDSNLNNANGPSNGLSRPGHLDDILSEDEYSGSDEEQSEVHSEVHSERFI